MSRAEHQCGGEIAKDPSLGDHPLVKGVALGPFETNCYIVRFPDSPDCWIVDAGFEPEELIDEVRSEQLQPQALILTHAHCDHMAGVSEVRSAFPKLPIWMHAAEADWLNDPLLNLSMMIGIPVTAPRPDRLLADGDELTLAGRHWRVLHTPGHSPGGISLYYAASGVLISGDPLLAGSIGRTDFPGSDHQQLLSSIRTKLYTLPDDTKVYSGHGPTTTIGREKRSNPFARPM